MRTLLVAFALIAVTGCSHRTATVTRVPAKSTDQPARRLLSKSPYMGVACGKPNSIACDRVGLAVWLRKPARSVLATIAGRRFELSDPHWSGGARNGQRRMFAGFLQPAGLVDGPLKVQVENGRSRWTGAKPVSARVKLLITRNGGNIDATSVRVGLSPGWG
jgi:hypothetical protein